MLLSHTRDKHRSSIGERPSSSNEGSNNLQRTTTTDGCVMRTADDILLVRDHRLPVAGSGPINAIHHHPHPHHHHHHHHHTSKDPPQTSNISRNPSKSIGISVTNINPRRSRRLSNSSVASTASSGFVTAPASPYSASQPERPSLEARSSSFSKRAPASHSSHGVETSSGPPPALITQRSYIAELMRNSQDSAQQQQRLFGANASTSTGREDHPMSAHRASDDRMTLESSGEASSTELSRPDRNLSSDDMDMLDHGDGVGVVWEGDDGDATIRAPVSAQSECDDPFLRLARSNTTSQSAKDAAARSERRKLMHIFEAMLIQVSWKSRIELGKHRQTLSTTELPPPNSEPSSSRRPFEGRGSTPVNKRPATSNGWDHQKRPSLSRANSLKTDQRYMSRDRQSVFSAQNTHDYGHSQLRAMDHRGSLSALRASSNGSVSPKTYNEPEISVLSYTADPNSKYPFQQSSLSYPSRPGGPSSNGHGVPMLENDCWPGSPRADGTESMASTTAPSTVWDELEDLKSRIRRLELTGRLPATSGAAVFSASGERPSTATTTATTISSSPKRHLGNHSPPSQSLVGGPGGANIYTLLHASLANAKPVMGSEPYRALESTASDALSLAAMLGSEGPHGTPSSAASIVGGDRLSDRQLRRKVDSMCRNLTELCVALGDITPSSITTSACVQTVPQASSGGMPASPFHQPQDLPTYRRSHLEGQEFDPSTLSRSGSRALDRLDARRASLLSLNTPITSHSSLSQLPMPTSESSSRSKRHSLVPTFLSRHRALDQENDSDDSPLRAPSRAMTSLSQYRNSPREHRTPREYTSRHPLPSYTPPSAQGTIQSRRHHVSSSLSGTPQAFSSPIAQMGVRRYLQQTTPPVTDRGKLSAATEQDRNAAQERARRIDALNQYSSFSQSDDSTLLGSIDTSQVTMDGTGWRL